MTSRARVRSLAAVGATVVVVAGILAGCQLPGQQFVVTTTDDAVDAAPGDGVCEATAGAGDCTLRAAVMEANAVPGSNDIEIGDGHVYSLFGSPGEDGALAGDLDITESVSINGRSTVDANSGDRAFDVLGGSAFIDGVTVLDGFQSGAGGGIHVGPQGTLSLSHATIADGFAFDGGALYNEGTSSIVDSRITNNNAFGGNQSTDVAHARGAGILTSGRLTLTRTSVVGNFVESEAPGQAVYATPTGRVTIDSSTIDRSIFADNRAGSGGPSALVTIRRSTISDAADAVVLKGGRFDIASSTIVGGRQLVFGSSTTATVGGSALDAVFGVCADGQNRPSPPELPAQITSTGYNVASDSTCALSHTGDRQGVDLLLGPLASNGGPTQTHLPAANSPVVDAIPFPTSGLCESGQRDQRGQPVPANGRCDVGAVEGASSQAIHPLHLVVTSADTAGDSQPGNGVCDGGPTGCTLRAAIDETNAWPGADMIDLTGGLNPVLQFGPTVTDSLTIHGHGDTIRSAGSIQFGHVGGDLVLDHVTMVADAQTFVLVNSSGGGSLRIVDSELVGRPGVAFSDDHGSTAVISSVPTVIDSSTFTRNGRSGIELSTDSLIVNSTFTGNGMPEAGHWSVRSGDIINFPCQATPRFTVSIVASTIADSLGGANLAAGCFSRMQVFGTVVVDGGCAPSSIVSSLGYNHLTDPDFCGPPAPTDVGGTVLLAPLAENGGPTPTRLQQPGSAALNRIPVGTAGLCTPGLVDQRNVLRPVGPACDISATEGTS